MSRTIYQRIALEGGKGIADELRKIGKDGEAAFVEIRGAAAKLSKDLGAVGDSFRKLGGSLATVGKRLGIAGAAAVGAAAGVVALAKSGTDLADSANKQAQALGLAIDEYGRLSFAASQSGVDAGTFGTAITRLNQEVAKAADGNEAALGKFQELGISIRDAGGQVKSTETLMKELADRFALLPDGAEKSALAVQLFGRSGAQLLPLLNGGAEGIKNLGDEATRLGIVFTKEQAVIAEGMNDALEALQAGVRGTRAQIGLLFAPAITEAARGFQKVIEDNRVAITEFVDSGIQRALPIVRDFINAVIGNDVEVSNLWILEARDQIIEFGNSARSAITDIIVPAYELVIDAANKVAEAINKVFGTDFTGQELLISAAIVKLVGGFGLLKDAVVLLIASLKLGASSMNLLTKAAPLLGAALTTLGTQARRVGLALLPLLGWPALLIAAFVGLPILLYVYWDEIVAGAQWAWGVLKDGFNRAWELIKQGAAAALEWVAEKLTGLGDRFAALGQQAAELFGAGLEKLADLAAGIWEKVTAAGEAAVEKIKTGWTALSSFFADLWHRITDGAVSVFGFLRDGFQNAVDIIGNLFDGLANRIERIWERIKSIIASAKSAASSINANNTGTSSRREGFASGGYVRGPGTGTSDSILARLSDGEFVIRAAAVRKYGPQLLAAINSMRFKMPGYALGGMVQTAALPQINLGSILDSLTHGMVYGVPALADGGMVAAQAQAQGRPISLTIDGRTFDGLTASDKTAEELSRYATNRRLRSAGRKPGWVG